jgi:CubicO group peptidase (beta-lactamase class C family)
MQRENGGKVVMSLDARIDRVLADLRPEMPFRDPGKRVRKLADRMAELSTPGVSIAVIDDFDVVWAKGFGVRKAGGLADVRADTPFQAGSISKPVFALAVMRLCQGGRLELDADVRTYLRSWQLPASDDGWTPMITLRQLLSHTAGTTVHGFPGYPVAGQSPSLPQVLDGTPPVNTSPVFVDLIPGLQFRYSGGGITIAQLAVTDAVGGSFADLMRDLVLGPLGMRDSGFEQPPPLEIANRAAAGHPYNNLPVPGDWHIYPEMAAAGLWTTAADLGRLGVALMRSLRGEPNGASLSREAIAAMLRPQLPRQAPGTRYTGLGWGCAGEGEGFHFGHTGSNQGFYADMCLYPATGQGAVVMTNANQGWRLPQELFRSIAREHGWPHAAPPSNEGTSVAAAEIAGAYRDAAGRVFRVEQHGEEILLHVDGNGPIRLTASAKGRFYAKLPEIELRFAHNAEGTPALTLSQEGRSFDALIVRDNA